jgi:hypothetical protein
MEGVRIGVFAFEVVEGVKGNRYFRFFCRKTG